MIHEAWSTVRMLIVVTLQPSAEHELSTGSGLVYKSSFLRVPAFGSFAPSGLPSDMPTSCSSSSEEEMPRRRRLAPRPRPLPLPPVEARERPPVLRTLLVPSACRPLPRPAPPERCSHQRSVSQSFGEISKLHSFHPGVGSSPMVMVYVMAYGA